jgi:hypothetical protein
MDTDGKIMHRLEAVSDEILRDYFAAAALGGMIAQTKIDWDKDLAAMRAYKYADAMMKRRVMFRD